MILLAWRQFRTQAAGAVAVLVAVAAVAAVTGPHLIHVYNTAVVGCRARGDCSAVTAAFLQLDTGIRAWLGFLVILAPAIIGIFWGAPLVAREIEGGTFRLAWTQSVTRTRWLAVKLGVVGLASAAAAGLISLLVTWWASPLDQVKMNRFATYDQRGVVAVGYAVFAFALGVTAGVVVRRTLPAMATTMVAFITARLMFIHWLRPRLFAPAVRSVVLDPLSTGFGSSSSLLRGASPDNLQPVTPNIPNAWITSSRIVDGAGHALTSQVLKNACPTVGQGAPGPGAPSQGPVPAGVQQALHDCVVKVGATYHQLVTYQPANRYWALQWYETVIFLGAALALAGCCVWWVRRRLS
jgi:hypothetical protein